MSDYIYYEAFGEIWQKTPLEPFYEAMLPLLKSYGLTAEFPADKPSLAYDGVTGIKFDFWIGEPPAAIRYLKCQESPYGMGGFELTLESETLAHTATGENLHIKIFITDYISGLSGTNGYFWLTVRFSGAKTEVERLKNAVAPVLAEYNFRSGRVKTVPVPEPSHDNSPANSVNNSKSDVLVKNINFAALAPNSTPVLHYQETGEIDDKTPLEPFYDAMLPLLANYGFAEKFPEGRISTMSGGYTGYEYDIFIGAPPPPVFRYTNVMPGGYSAFCDEQRTLESIGLTRLATGEGLFIRIDINNSYSDGNLRLTLVINGAKPEVERFKTAFAPVLSKYNFKSQNIEENIKEAKPQFADEN